MRLYGASRATVQHATMWKRLRDLYHWPITSTWIDDIATEVTPITELSDMWNRIDDEVYDATDLILYVRKEDFPLKGALVEVGMALANGAKVYVVVNDVELEPCTCKPLGSWINHSGVSLVSNLELLGTVLGL